MPTPPRTSLDEIVRAGRDVLDREGLDAVTMQRVASIVGVRAPSLYKRVRDRDALVRLIAEAVLADLGAALSGAVTLGDPAAEPSAAVTTSNPTGDPAAEPSGSVTTGDPAADLRAIAIAFRAWALLHPGGFGLLFARLPDALRLEADPRSEAIEPVLRTVAALTGPDRALDASRMVGAWASGFVSMELAGTFQLGGDVDAAFAFGIERLAAAIALPQPAR